MLRLAASCAALAWTLAACSHRTAVTTTTSTSSASAASAASVPPAQRASSAPLPAPAPAATHAATSAPAPAASAAAVSRARAAARPYAGTVARQRHQPAPVRASSPARAAAAVPEILGMSVSPTVVRSGMTVSADVRTTPGVVGVTAFAGGAAMAVPRVASGEFAGSATIPALPPFVHGVFPVTFVARDAAGRSTQAAVSVTVP